MALSGSKSVTLTTWDTLIFNWSATQSIENNTSTIQWVMNLKSTAFGAINSSASKKWSVTIGGKTFSGTNSVAIGNNTTKALASGSVTVSHANNGAYTLSYTFEQQFDIDFDSRHIGTARGNGSTALNTIPRVSQPSCITWPQHTQNVGEFGDTISIHMNRKASTLTHTVRYQFGNQSGTIGTNVGTGTTWTIPLTLMNLIPNSTTGSGTIFVDTYSGSTLLGTASCGFTATVPASVKPSCSFTLEDVAVIATMPDFFVDDFYGSPVKGLSKIKIKVTTITAYNSPIASCIITANGSTYSATEATTGVLKTAGTSPVTVTVKDKRGRTATSSYNMNVQDYSQPSVTKLQVRRCDQDGTPNEQGEYAKVTYSANVTSLNNKNLPTYEVWWKKSTDAQYLAGRWEGSGVPYTVTNKEYIFKADTGSSYDVQVYAKDRHFTSNKSAVLSTAFTLMHWGADGTSIGLLKMAEKPNALDIGGDVYLNGNAIYGAHGMFDNRSTNELPEWYMENYGRGTVWEFKELTVIGFTAPSTKFAPVETIIPWQDSSGGLPRQVTYEGRTRWTRIANSTTTWGAWQSDALIAYPVGSIYIAYNHTDPGTLFGGTWVRLTGGFLWASQSTDIIGQTGGAKEVALTVKQIPSHNHGGTYTNAGTATKTHAWLASGGSAMAYDTVNTGSGEAHNNMPPYIQVSIWRRTA